MANSKNTKKDRDEKKSGDLSELHNSYSFDAENDFESESAQPEFTSKFASSKDDEEDRNSTSVFASKINKSYGNDSSFESMSNGKRVNNREDFRSASPQPYTGRTHQLSYDQQFRAQQPQYQQPYETDFYQKQPFSSAPPFNQGFQQGTSNPDEQQDSFSHNQAFENDQQRRYQYPYNQGAFQNRNFRQPNYNQSFGYQQPFGQQPSNQYFEPHSFNQFNPYVNQFRNEQPVNRGYENYYFNDQSNRYRSSFNTQGFGNSVYRHENFQPDPSGSGYAGSTFGGQGQGEFRSNEQFNEHQRYDSPDFRFRREQKKPSFGFNQNYRMDEQERNNYQQDEDGFKRGFRGFSNSYAEDHFNGFNSPYGNEREEQYGYEREFSQNQRPFNERERFENPTHGFQNFQGTKGTRRRRHRDNNY